jgi:hypothetical protein
MLFVQRDIADARNLVKIKYFKLTQVHKSSTKGITEFINTSMDAKRIQIDSSLAKHLFITDPSLGHGCLAQIKRHYDL